MKNKLLEQKITDLEQENFILKEKLERLGVKSTQNETINNLTRQPRNTLDSDIELASAFDIIEAEGINLSVGGICFEVAQPLLFDMQFQKEGEMIAKKASLMWVEKRKDYGFYIGLKFAEDTDS